jgi:hypothetical protein
MVKIYLYKLFVILSGFIFCTSIFAQGKVELSAGVAIPGALNIKIKYGKDFQVGTSVGFLPLNEELDIPVEVEASFHFLGKAKYVDQPPWFVTGGFQLVNIEISDETWFDYLMGFYLRFGRSFNVSQKTGLNFDLGAMFPINQPQDNAFHIGPSASIGFFFRL